jgi:hypothetical protein
MSVALPMPKPKPVPEEPAIPRETVVLADAARRIMREDVYIRARDGMRTNYLERLAKADPLNTDVIVQLQATIRAIDGLDSELLKFTHAVARPRQTGI